MFGDRILFDKHIGSNEPAPARTPLRYRPVSKPDQAAVDFLEALEEPQTMITPEQFLGDPAVYWGVPDACGPQTLDLREDDPLCRDALRKVAEQEAQSHGLTIRPTGTVMGYGLFTGQAGFCPDEKNKGRLCRVRSAGFSIFFGRVTTYPSARSIQNYVRCTAYHWSTRRHERLTTGW